MGGCPAEKGFAFNPFQEEDAAAAAAEAANYAFINGDSARSAVELIGTSANGIQANEAPKAPSIATPSIASGQPSPITSNFHTSNSPSQYVFPSSASSMAGQAHGSAFDSSSHESYGSGSGSFHGPGRRSPDAIHKIQSSQSSIASTKSVSSQPSVISFDTAARSARRNIPVAGFRIPATSNTEMPSFPLLEMCGPAFADASGHPTYVCSAILGSSVHPGKAGPHLSPPVRISLSGLEVDHSGRYDILPLTPEMQWVTAADGRTPEGYTPISGGYEESGEQLYHAVAKIDGCWVPGKTARHLAGANFPFAHKEVQLTKHYKILCWRKIRPE